MTSKPIPLVRYHGAEITEPMIRTLVETFYGRVRRDPLLGPIFEPVLAHGWDAHIDRLVDFWSSVVLRTGRYGGQPHAAHAGLALAPAHFHHWLALFESTAQEVCPPAAAEIFVDRAHRIAAGLQASLGISTLNQNPRDERRD
jgi:hemoglobin